MDGEKEPDALDMTLIVAFFVSLGVFFLSFQGVRDHLFDLPPQVYQQPDTTWPVVQ